MAINDSARRTNIYAGLAGENTPGRVVNAGLYRMAEGDGRWEQLTSGLPESPAVTGHSSPSPPTRHRLRGDPGRPLPQRGPGG